MTDEAGMSANGDAEEGAEGEARQRASGRLSWKKLLVFGGVGLFVLIGAGAGAYFAGLFAGSGDSAEAAGEALPAAHYLDLDQMVVTLGSGGKSGFLKMKISLELENPADEPRIKAVLPRIVDNFQVFLRELRVEELQGSHGLYRVKEELLARVNATAHPTKVRQVLLKEMLVQ